MNPPTFRDFFFFMYYIRDKRNEGGGRERGKGRGGKGEEDRGAESLCKLRAAEVEFFVCILGVFLGSCTNITSLLYDTPVEYRR